MKLTRPQRRILEAAVEEGSTIVYGRNGAAVLNLRDKELVTVDWGHEPSAQGFRDRIVVTPTEAGRALLR